MYVRDNVVSAKCFSGKCNFWKVFFGEVYRIRRKYQRIPLPALKTNSANYAIQYTVTWQGDSEKTRRSSRSAATLPILFVLFAFLVSIIILLAAQNQSHKKHNNWKVDRRLQRFKILFVLFAFLVSIIIFLAAQNQSHKKHNWKVDRRLRRVFFVFTRPFSN